MWFFHVFFSLELQEGKAQIFPSGGPSLEKGRLCRQQQMIFTTFHCPVLAVLAVEHVQCTIPHPTPKPAPVPDFKIPKARLSPSPSACAGPITHTWSTKPYFWRTQGELHREADAQRHAIQGAIEHHGLKSAISHEAYQTMIG